MPTDKPRVSAVLDDKILAMIEQYRYSNGISSTSKAVAELLKRGVARQETELEGGTIFSGEELKIINKFRRTDESGRSAILDAVIRADAYSKQRKSLKYPQAEEYIADVTIEEIESLIGLYRRSDKQTRGLVLELLTGAEETE